MTAKPPKPLALRVAIWAGACLAVAVLVAAFWPSIQPTYYQGHSLAYWFKRLPWVNTSPNVGVGVGPSYPVTSADVADCEGRARQGCSPAPGTVRCERPPDYLPCAKFASQGPLIELAALSVCQEGGFTAGFSCMVLMASNAAWRAARVVHSALCRSGISGAAGGPISPKM